MAAVPPRSCENIPTRRVLVVGHSSAHRLLLCRLLGLPLSSYRRVFPVFRNCAVTTVRWNGTDPAALIQYNVPPDHRAVAV